MKKGFTLIELMLSVVILGCGLVIIIQSYLSSLNGLNIAQNYVQALNFAKAKLGEIELASYENKGALPELEPQTGKVRLGLREFNWISRINEIAEPEYLTKDLVEVCIKLNWQERNIAKDAAVATYLPRLTEISP